MGGKRDRTSPHLNLGELLLILSWINIAMDLSKEILKKNAGRKR